MCLSGNGEMELAGCVTHCDRPLTAYTYHSTYIFWVHEVFAGAFVHPKDSFLAQAARAYGTCAMCVFSLGVSI